MQFPGGPPSTFVLVSTLDKKGNRSVSKRTFTIKKEPNPCWDVKLIFDVGPEVDMIELALYDRDSLIVDELLGVATIPPSKVPFGNIGQSDVYDDWFLIIHPSKSSVSLSSSLTSSTTGQPASEIHVACQYVDEQTKLAVETDHRQKEEFRLRKKEMKRLFNIDTAYVKDFSCGFDAGTIPHNGKLYLTTTHILFNSTFKSKSIAIDSIKYIEKYRTLFNNAGLMFATKEGRKYQFKNFRSRKAVIEAIQQQAKELGIAPIVIVDPADDANEVSDEGEATTGEESSKEDPVQSSFSAALQPPTIGLSGSPTSSVTVSPSPPLKKASSGKLSSIFFGDKESKEGKEGSKEKEKDHKRTPSNVAASFVKSVSEKIRTIGASSSSLSSPKDSAPLTHSTGALMDSVNIAPLPTSSTTTHTSTLHASIPSQIPSKTKPDKDRGFSVSPPAFLKDFSLPFHFSKKRQLQASEGLADSQMADRSSSSSENEPTDDSEKEREQSYRLKYYLIHGEVPLGSGEEESENDNMKSPVGSSKVLKRANSSLRRSIPVTPPEESSAVDLVTASGSADDDDLIPHATSMPDLEPILPHENLANLEPQLRTSQTMPPPSTKLKNSTDSSSPTSKNSPTHSHSNIVGSTSKSADLHTSQSTLQRPASMKLLRTSISVESDELDSLHGKRKKASHSRRRSVSSSKRIDDQISQPDTSHSSPIIETKLEHEVTSVPDALAGSSSTEVVTTRRKSTSSRRKYRNAKGEDDMKPSPQMRVPYKLNQNLFPQLILRTGLFSFFLALAILLKSSGGSLLNGTVFYKSGGTFGMIGISLIAALGTITAQGFVTITSSILHVSQLSHLLPSYLTHPLVLEHVVPILLLLMLHCNVLVLAVAIFSVLHNSFDGLLISNELGSLLNAHSCILYVLFSSIGCHLIAHKAVEQVDLST